jgi:predicted transcriptional regulator
MVKNNVHKTAETDLHKAVVLNALDIATTMVKSSQAEINEIPGLVDKIVQAFSNSAAVSGVFMPLADVAVAAVEASAAPVEQKTSRKKGSALSGASHQAIIAAETPVIETPDVEPAAVAEVASADTVETVVAKRGRGRPRKIVIEEPKPKLSHSKTETGQAKYDRLFRKRNPPICSIEESLMDNGDGKMTCLIDGKRVSHLKSYLAKTFGISFAEYQRIYDLPADYPVSPPAFRASKQEFAKTVGLGTSEMRQAHKEKLASVGSDGDGEPVADTPNVVARPSGRTRKTTVVDIASVAAAA